MLCYDFSLLLVITDYRQSMHIIRSNFSFWTSRVIIIIIIWPSKAAVTTIILFIWNLLHFITRQIYLMRENPEPEKISNKLQLPQTWDCLFFFKWIFFFANISPRLRMIVFLFCFVEMNCLFSLWQWRHKRYCFSQNLLLFFRNKQFSLKTIIINFFFFRFCCFLLLKILKFRPFSTAVYHHYSVVVVVAAVLWVSKSRPLVFNLSLVDSVLLHLMCCAAAAALCLFNRQC